MYIYQRYILRHLTGVFLASVFIITGLLFVGNMLKIVYSLAMGIRLVLILKMILYMVPDLLSYALPMSILTSCLLVFGKLSADNELIALRSNGISLVRIISTAVVFAVLIGCISLIQQGIIKPAAFGAWKRLKQELVQANPTALFIPGQTVDVSDDFSIYIGDRKRGILYDLKIMQSRKDSQQDAETPYITAKWGEVINLPQQGRVRLDLYDYKNYLALGTKGGSGIAEEKGERMEIGFDLKTERKRKKQKLVKTDIDEMTIKEIQIQRKIAGERGGNTLEYTLEMNKRIVFSLSCIAFAMLGIPLGIKMSRSEKMIGFAVSLPLFLSYYMAQSLIRKLDGKPQWHPEMLLFLPNLIIALAGLWLFYRIYRGAK